MATPIGIGIDVAKAKFDVADSQGNLLGTFQNNEAGIQRALRTFPQTQHISCCVLEATGGYENRLLNALFDADIPTVRIQPGRARAFAKSLGKRAKTDTIDALLLAKMTLCALDDHPRWVPPSEDEAQLRALVDRRRQLKRILESERKRREWARGLVAEDLDSLIATLQERIGRMESAIASLLSESAELSEKAGVLSGVPGVGRVTVATLLAHVPELGHLDRRTVASLLGVAPFNDDSGNGSKKRFIQGGRPAARQALYMAALVGIRHNPVLREYYQGLKARGKPGKVALVACMRKLAIYLNSLLKPIVERPTHTLAEI